MTEGSKITEVNRNPSINFSKASKMIRACFLNAAKIKSAFQGTSQDTNFKINMSL